MSCIVCFSDSVCCGMNSIAISRHQPHGGDGKQLILCIAATGSGWVAVKLEKLMAAWEVLWVWETSGARFAAEIYSCMDLLFVSCSQLLCREVGDWSRISANSCSC